MTVWWMLALGATLVALGWALAWVWLRRLRLRRLIPRKPLRLRHPVVLAHGILGFDEIAVLGRRHRYFRNIADGLTGLDAQFHHPRVSPAGSVETRAAQLAAMVRELPDPRVNIVAHSMGGLDARHAIARLGLHGRVASLVTIGTPHRGTPLADLGERIVSAAISRPLARVLDLRGLHDLTTEGVRIFNRDNPDAPGVAYCSVVGSSRLSRTNPMLWPSQAFLKARSGANDGLVPATSQRWGTVMREIEADHWAQAGWSWRFDAVGLYAEILRELVGLGF
jgi:triacylglycerol lipase